VDECKPLSPGGGAPVVRRRVGAGAVAQPADVPVRPGRAVQADPIKLTLKPPGTKYLKVKYDILLSISAYKFNLRRYNPGATRCVKSDRAVAAVREDRL
jgi:hypothetical protein